MRRAVAARPATAVALAALAGAAAALGITVVAGSSGAPASAGERAREAVRLELVAGGLQSPVDVTAAPGDRDGLYVAEQPGRVVRLEEGDARARVVLDLTDRVRASGEQGLLGLAFHPDYARNGRLYVHYSDRRGDTRVVEYRSDGRPVRELLHVRQPYENHNGGQLAFAPDGALHLGLGDGGSAFDPEARAQDPGSPLGKILRFDVDRPGARPEVVALGLRNPWRFAFSEAGDLYIADVGQDAWEEVNVLPAGERGLVNFGWDVYEGPDRVERRALGPGRLAGPVAAYPHGDECSITGGRVYRGDLLPSLRGRYVYGDYCSGRIWSLRWEGGERADVRVEAARLPTVTAFGEGPDRELYLTAQPGALYRLTFVP